MAVFCGKVWGGIRWSVILCPDTNVGWQLRVIRAFKSMMEDMEERLSMHSLPSSRSNQRPLSDISYIDEDGNSKSPVITNNNYTMVTDAASPSVGGLYYHNYINNSFQPDAQRQYKSSPSNTSGSEFALDSSPSHPHVIPPSGIILPSHPQITISRHDSNILYLDPLSDFHKLVHETSI